jgi:hypothetical protein
MRYILGPSIASVGLSTVPPDPTPEPGPVTLVDVDVTIASADDSGVAIVVPPFDATTHQAAAEYKVFLAPEGSTFPGDVHGWLASPFAVSTVDHTADPAGSTIKVPMPIVPPGAYFLQTVLGFAA